MRIVGGEKKGFRLKGPYIEKVRPAMDKVKDSLFSMLYPLEMSELEVLDVFAGTGSIGLESLSRGCKYALFIEANRIMAKNIKDNIEFLNYTSKAKVFSKDFRIALRMLHKNKEKFDIIFSDPPYNLGLVNEFLKTLEKYNVLKENGLLIMEIDKNELPNIPPNLKIMKERSYGRTNILIFQQTV
jgi:16S rRNA (guanine(966)-N(2))-methyltransferase RsmD